MIFPDKLLKQIPETTYLTTDNTYRYRVIIRIMFHHYERIQYWLYAQDIIKEMQADDRFKDYTLEECKRDLQALEGWGNLIALQDTSQVKTLDEYKNRNFRYQLTEYTVEIERMTIRLENLTFEGASLEPSLLERIKENFEQLPILLNNPNTDNEQLTSWWNALNDQFIRLNQNYQDYIRTLNSASSEELMKTTEFLLYKDAIIGYLRKFVRSLQVNSSIIEQHMTGMTQIQLDELLERVVRYELSIPRLDKEVTYDALKERSIGRWKSMSNWFVSRPGQMSEAYRIFDITNETVRKITRYASQISEIYGSGYNRKDSYSNLFRLFAEAETLEECHKLAALAFGIKQPVHLKSNFERPTESVSQSVYQEAPIDLRLKSRVRKKAAPSKTHSIRQYKEEKQRVLRESLQQQAEDQALIDQYIHHQTIDFENLGIVDTKVRNILLRWLSKGLENQKSTVQTEDGRKYSVHLKDKQRRIILKAEDGWFEMPAYQLIFHDDFVKSEVENE